MLKQKCVPAFGLFYHLKLICPHFSTRSQTLKTWLPPTFSQWEETMLSEDHSCFSYFRFLIEVIELESLF